MKKINIFVVLTAIVALTPAVSFAYDGTINLTGNLRPTTCVVTTPNVTIPLTPATGIPTRTFTGVGSASNWTSASSILLDCTGNTADVYMTVTDATNNGNTSSILSLTSSSTATGLGIELSIFGKPKMSFGPDSSSIGNMNQFLIANAANAAGSALRIDLSARYIQTGDTVSSGTANGLATFTMAYK